MLKSAYHSYLASRLTEEPLDSIVSGANHEPQAYQLINGIEKETWISQLYAKLGYTAEAKAKHTKQLICQLHAALGYTIAAMPSSENEIMPGVLYTSTEYCIEYTLFSSNKLIQGCIDIEQLKQEDHLAVNTNLKDSILQSKISAILFEQKILDAKARQSVEYMTEALEKNKLPEANKVYIKIEHQIKYKALSAEGEMVVDYINTSQLNEKRWKDEQKKEEREDKLKHEKSEKSGKASKALSDEIQKAKEIRENKVREETIKTVDFTIQQQHHFIEDIFFVTSGKHQIGRGLLDLADGKIVEDDVLQWLRNTIFILVTGAFATEFGYAVLQFVTSGDTLSKLIPIVKVVTAIISIGTVLDLFVNIWTTSARRDADETAMSSLAQLSPAVARFAYAMMAISYSISFPAGASGNIGYILPYLSVDPSNVLAYTGIICLTVLVTLLGVAYYTTFNIGRTIATISDIENYRNAPKADYNLYRGLEITIENLQVFLFRAASFSMISLKTLAGLQLKLSHKQRLAIAFTVLAATILNIMITRSKKIVDRFSNNKFAYIESDEKKHALAQVPVTTYVSFSTFLALSRSAGLLMIPDTKNAVAYYTCLCLSILMLANSVIAQRDLTANNSVLENLGDAEINRRKHVYALSLKANSLKLNEGSSSQKSSPTTELGSESDNSEKNPLISSSYLTDNEATTPLSKKELKKKETAARDKRIKAASAGFSAIAATFSDASSSCGLPYLQILSIVTALGSVCIRALSFQSLWSKASDLLNLKQSELTSWGVVIFCAGANMRSLYDAFQPAIMTNITLSLSEEYTHQCSQETVDVENSNRVTPKPKFTSYFYTNCYLKGQVEYTIKDLKRAITHKIEELEIAADHGASFNNRF